MTIQLNSCDAAKPDRRAISKLFEEIGEGVDRNLAAELTDILLNGSEIEIQVADNNISSVYRSLRKLDIDYDID